jgi:adenine-specific DNA methylase
LPGKTDSQAVADASAELERKKNTYRGPLALVPDERISMNEIRRISIPIYGMESWGDVFSNRQNLALQALARLPPAR